MEIGIPDRIIEVVPLEQPLSNPEQPYEPFTDQPEPQVPSEPVKEPQHV